MNVLTCNKMIAVFSVPAECVHISSTPVYMFVCMYVCHVHAGVMYAHTFEFFIPLSAFTSTSRLYVRVYAMYMQV